MRLLTIESVMFFKPQIFRDIFFEIYFGKIEQKKIDFNKIKKTGFS
jgi:hypothetical protein